MSGQERFTVFPGVIRDIVTAWASFQRAAEFYSSVS